MLSKLLSLIILIGSLIIKLPQILNMISRKDATGAGYRLEFCDSLAYALLIGKFSAS